MKKMGKRILAMLCAITIMMSLIVLPEIGLKAEAAEGLNLESMQIVLPARSTEVERTAANELRTYIQKITGKVLTLNGEGQSSGAGIYIGKTNYAQSVGVTYPTEGDTNGEAWAIKAVNGNLVLCGAPERGVLYAVYHLLEDVLGVHWWNLWEEYVPTGSAIVPADYADSGVPAMEYREVYVGKETNTDYEFYARNRVNGNFGNIPAAYGSEESYGYAHVHTFKRYITSADYNAHPEWFAQINGKRDSSGQLCLTNSALKTEFAARLNAEVAKNPNAIYSVSPADVVGKFCQCSSCKSQINTYGLSGYILKFVNEMAAAVTAAGYTEATVEMLAYWEYVDAPKGGVTPAENVQVRFADLYTDLLHSINHANNASSKAELQEWANITGNNVYYWQYVIHNNINGVFPTMFHYGDDFTTLQEMGVNGWFAEQEQCVNADFWDMKLWLITKLMEKPVTGEEYTALMDEFIYGYYGDAAGKHIRDYLYYMNAKAEATNVSKNFGFGTEIIEAEWLSVQDIIAGNEYFEKAFTAAAGDAILLRRLRAARGGLDRVIVENYGKWQSQAKSAGLTLPFTWREVGQRVEFTIAEQAAFRGGYDTEYQELLEYRYDIFGNDQPALPSALGEMDPGHYIEFTVRDMLAAGSGFSVVEDPDSLTGMAIRGEAAKDSSLIMSSSSWTGTGRVRHYLYYYDGESSTDIGSIKYNGIQANAGYQDYSFRWTVPSDIKATDVIYLFDSWGFQNRQMAGQLQAFAGQSVNVHLNMKVTGNIYDSTAVYYIDRMIVVPTSWRTTHSYAVKPSTYGVECRSICTICGDAKLTEHNWDSGVVTVEPTVETAGEKLFTCQSCGKTKTETVYAESLPEELWGIDPRHIKQYDATYFTDPAGMGSVLVEDADSPLGQAYYNEGLAMYSWLSTAYRNDYGGEKWLTDVHKDNVPIDGQYHFYKFTWEVPADLSADKSDIGVYHGGKWIASNEQIAQEVQAYKGQTVDFYVSIKIDGTAESTKCYVDQMLLVEQCQGADCPVCGSSGESSQGSLVGLPAELKRLDPQHIKQFDASYFTDPHEMGSALVEDADSPLGQAYYHEGLAMYSWLSTAYRNDYGGEKWLTDVHKDNVPIDGQYHFYKFTWDVPTDLSADNADIGVYHGGKWIASNEKIAQAAVAYKGKTVDFYVSIKIDGTAESTKCYVDQMILAEQCVGDSCPVCGDKLDVATLPEELWDVDPRHIKQYDATYFTDPEKMGSVLVEDANSPLGQAYYNEGLAMGSWLSTAYRNNYTGEKWLVDVQGGTVPIDGQYHFYKFTWDVPTDLSADNADIGVYHGGKWIASNQQIAQAAVAYKGKTVDFYISIKIFGTSDNTKIYVDQMLLVDSCENNNVDGFCSVCGMSLVVKSLPEELRYMNAKHIKQYDATYFTDPHKMGSVLVQDANSPLGQAYYNEGLAMGSWLSTAHRNNYGSEKWLVDVHGSTVPIDGQYHFYKYTWAVPADLNTTVADIGVYHGGKWIASNQQIAKDVEAYKGKTVDFYVSIKIDGSAESTKCYVDQMLLVDFCDENWDNGVVTTQPTVEAEGVKTYTCTVCGATRTETIPKLPNPVTNWNLVLDGNIGMKFYLNVTSGEAAKAAVDVTVNGETTTKNVADLLVDGRYVLTVELAAAQMADNVTVTLYKNGQKMSKDYSVRGYADYILADTEGDYTEEAKNLVKYMLAYGGASQTYFGYNDAEENLADNGIEVTPAAVPTEGGVYSVTGSAKGVKYYGASLVYRNKIAVRIYFSGDVTGKTFTVNGEAVTPETNGDLHYIEVANIYPQDLAGSITVAVDGLTVTYSPVDYIIRMYTKGGTVAALVQALYGYYVAADAYIA